MSSQVAASTTEPTRRQFNGREADTVQRLADAALDELRAHDYAGLTVRNVARRAGVAPATAYTYFSSKEHLVAEVFWRRLSALPVFRPDRRRGAAARVAAAMRDVEHLVVSEPELAAASTTALLSTDPDVKHLRDTIGEFVHARLSDALGLASDPAIVRVLELAFTGALVQAGMGHLAYEELGKRLAEVTSLIVGARR